MCIFPNWLDDSAPPLTPWQVLTLLTISFFWQGTFCGFICSWSSSCLVSPRAGSSFPPWQPYVPLPPAFGGQILLLLDTCLFPFRLQLKVQYVSLLSQFMGHPSFPNICMPHDRAPEHMFPFFKWFHRSQGTKAVVPSPHLETLHSTGSTLPTSSALGPICLLVPLPPHEQNFLCIEI